MSDTVQMTVTGMTCDHCVAAVTKAVRSTPGADAADVDIDLDSGVVKIASANPVDRDAVEAAIVDEGYEVS